MTLLQKLITILSSIALFNVFELNTDLITYISGGILIALLGIPHGATDHVLDHFTRSGKPAYHPTAGFIARYLLLIVIYTIVWILLPTFSLIVFLVLSAYHFGETQWLRSHRQNPSRILHFTWGGSLLGILFLIHYDDAFMLVSGVVATHYYLAGFMILAVVSILAVITWVWLISRLSMLEWLRHLTEFMMLILLFRFTPLLFGFVIFFSLWHSLDAIILQISGIRKSYPQFNSKVFLKAAYPFSLISLVGIALIVGALVFLDLNIHPVTLFLIMISLLTLPHMIEVEKFYRRVSQGE
jgi:Brp/Blh family beta-carotene 15,15'-monooxygenase